MPKILIVDDDKAMTSLLKKLLEFEPEGFEVRVAATGEHALELAHNDPPHLFMVDYNLRDMNGLELIAAIRETFGSVPVVMASGLDVEKEALAQGADVFIIKPFEPNDLTALFVDLMGL